MKLHLRTRMRLFWRRMQRFVIHTILHADDPPHRISLGVAIAMFITFTPTVGLQMMLAVFFAWLLRANKAVGLAIVWITNPLTIIPIFYFCYRVGRLILQTKPVGLHWWAQLTRPPAGWWDGVQFYWERFTHIAAPLWVGSLVVATVVAYASYYVSYYAICGYRMKRWGQLEPPPNLLHRLRRKKTG